MPSARFLTAPGNSPRKSSQRKSPECPECADNFSAGRMQDISREAELEEVKLRWSALQDKLRDEVIDKDVEKWEKNLEYVLWRGPQNILCSKKFRVRKYVRIVESVRTTGY